MKRTIPALFQNSVNTYASHVMMLEKKTTAFEPFTYRDIHDRVVKLAGAMYSIGLRKGDRATLMAEGCNDWIVSELALMHLGVANVPVSFKLLEYEEIKFRIRHSGSRMVVVSTNQLPKIRAIINDLPEVEKVIVFGGEPELNEREIHITEFENTGSDYFEAHSISFEQLWQSVDENDVATISYTSGTTAEPKGIMLSHRNYTANVEQAEGLFTIPSWYRTLLILPWDHSFAHTIGLYPLIKNGATIASVQVGKTGAEILKNIPVNIKEVQPTFLLSVPSLSKNFRKNIESAIAQKGKITYTLFRIALNTAYAYHSDGWRRGKGFRFLLYPMVKLFDNLLFKKVRDAFGGKLLFFVGGGALLDIELQRFFCAIGSPVFQGYGLTEASPVISSNTPDIHKFGSSGRLVPFMECRIVDEDGNELPRGQKGEIIIKGENVMLGYWKNEKATKETIKDGWLYTGDLGWIDQDDFLYVAGRFKSLLIAQDGEKYSPEGIEEALVAKSLFIDQIMLYNDHSAFTTALIFPKMEGLRKYARENKLDLHSTKAKEAVLKAIKEEISAWMQGGIYGGLFPERWLPSAFALIPEGFTEQNRLMNSTMKIVRFKIAEQYKDTLEYVYTPEAKDAANPRNMNVLDQLMGV